MNCENCKYMYKVIPSHKEGYCKVNIVGGMMKLVVKDNDYCEKYELKEKQNDR